jgi:lipopolysaccharide/colanic/teichoic acid biosynthesis glycosyltransferase
MGRKVLDIVLVIDLSAALIYGVVAGLALLVCLPVLGPLMAIRRRPVEVFVTLVLLAFFGVLMLLVAAAVRLDSRGPAIFRQRRAGRGGRPFTMLKFRTMRADTDPYGGSPQDRRDPRLTRLGRRLRETSLDELPQLLNVLLGTMSLVGPRPLYERQAAQWNPRQRRRLEVRPGITGYAQAFGRGGLTLEEKIELDVHYVENRSLWLDLRVIFRTIGNIFRRGGVYEQRYSREKQTEADSPPASRGARGGGADGAEK